MSISLRSDAGGNSGAIQVNGTDKLVVNSNGSLVASANPATGLRSMALATMQKFEDEFGASLSANGYQKLPSGLIIQWGSVTLSGATAQTVTFPITFPTALVAAVANYENSPGTTPVGITSKTATSMLLTQGSVGGNPTGSMKCPWIAIGY